MQHRDTPDLGQSHVREPPTFNHVDSDLTLRENAVLSLQGKIMTSAGRFDPKMDPQDKDIVARAAALMGTTMAGFVRAAAKEKAQALLEREARVTLSQRDFQAFTRALDSAFAPSPALKDALTQAQRKVRRA
jgi:uncharacterized protein (DUF1778 family)